MIVRNCRIGLLLVCVLWLVACSGTVSTKDSGNHGSTQVYPLSEDDAILVMRSAMEREFEADKISSVLSPHRGFQGKIRFIADIDTITVYAVPANGRGPDGSQIKGYAFEVKHAGTYPVGGIPKAKTVLERVVAGADRLASSLPHLE